MLTLQRLKQIVKKPEMEGKLPTARYLLEHGKRVASLESGREVQLLVFLEGYSLYRLGSHTTVFPVHSCGDYCYESARELFCVDVSYFDRQEWYVRLLLEGEDRLAKNSERYQKEKVVSYHAVSEEWFCLVSPLALPLEQLVEKEQVQELMGSLTERQRKIIVRYFYYGNTQGEIAEELGITQPTVSQVLAAALRRMKNGLEGKTSGKKQISGEGLLYAG